MIWLVIWVVLMILWLFGSGYIVYSTPGQANVPVAFFGGTLLPWCCVLILGLVIFGAVGNGPAVIVNQPVR